MDARPRADAQASSLPLRLAIIEDDREYLDPLVARLSQFPGFNFVGAFEHTELALAALRTDPPEIVLLDLRLRESDGTCSVRLLAEAFPTVRIVVLTSQPDPDCILAALEAGACAYLTKQTPHDEILAALHQAGQGSGMLSTDVARLLIAHFNQRGRRRSPAPELAPREREVLELLGNGLSYKQIASRLRLSPHTINDHVKSIYTKLQVHSRTAAIARYFGRDH